MAAATAAALVVVVVVSRKCGTYHIQAVIANQAPND